MLSKKWTEEETRFLMENYPNYGAEFCSKKLNRTIKAIRKRAKLLKIRYNRVKPIYHKEFLSDIILKSKSISEVLDNLSLRRAGGNYGILKKYINRYKIDTSHFYKNAIDFIPKIKMNLNLILVENSNYSRNSLKKRLYSEGLLNPVCCLCGQDENWNGMKISLILDHINGVYNDNRLENLRIVCPNCNAGLDTFAGKNREKVVSYCGCGEEKLKISERCPSCHGRSKRKVERPPFEQILKEVEQIGYCAVGRKYGVSDNAVRKWIKSK